MSGMEEKIVLRTKIQGLVGNYGEVYPYFKEKIGEANLEEDDYFEYNNLAKHPKDGYRIVPCNVYAGDQTQWGLELVLHHGESGDDLEGFDGTQGIRLMELTKLAKELADFAGTDVENVSFHSYSWYNGGDEPVYFKNATLKSKHIKEIIQNLPKERIQPNTYMALYEDKWHGVESVNKSKRTLRIFHYDITFEVDFKEIEDFRSIDKL